MASVPSSALLIGSWCCGQNRPVRGEEINGIRDRKKGIRGRRSFVKSTNLDSLTAWVEGDLDNMETLLDRKGIDLFYRLDYREQDPTGLYMSGKFTILRKINAFFQQDNITHFILYYTGHSNQDGSWIFAVTTQAANSNVQSVSHSFERPPAINQWIDLVTYEEVIELWDSSNKKGQQRFLMIILDCAYSGRWVQMVNEGFELDEFETVSHTARHVSKRTDICIQASCRATEVCNVADNQMSSVFTRAFVAAQNRSIIEKFILSLLDHIFILNIVSIARSLREGTFTPISTENRPFAGIKFFNSFDDMYLQTS